MKIKELVVGMVQTNCYIVYNEEIKEAVVIDPGDEAERITAECRKLGVEVKAILLTHGHFDHVMAVPELKKTWNVSVYAYEKEVGLLLDEAYNLSEQFIREKVSVKTDIALQDRAKFDMIGYTFELIATPGHTAGSCCYYIESEKTLFSGDTLFEGSYGRVDFPGSSSTDMLHSVAEVLLDLPDEVKVYPGHMGYTTIGTERKNNPLAPWRGRGL